MSDLAQLQRRYRKLKLEYNFERNWSKYNVNTLPDGLNENVKFQYAWPEPQNNSEQWVLERIDDLREPSPIKNIFLEMEN
jgi:hypothetical protein